MTARITSHRLVLPRPWTRLPLRGNVEGRVDQLVAVVASGAPKDVPPDTLTGL